MPNERERSGAGLTKVGDSEAREKIASFLAADRDSYQRAMEHAAYSANLADFTFTAPTSFTVTTTKAPTSGSSIFNAATLLSPNA